MAWSTAEASTATAAGTGGGTGAGEGEGPGVGALVASTKACGPAAASTASGCRAPLLQGPEAALPMASMAPFTPGAVARVLRVTLLPSAEGRRSKDAVEASGCAAMPARPAWFASVR